MSRRTRRVLPLVLPAARSASPSPPAATTTAAARSGAGSTLELGHDRGRGRHRPRGHLRRRARGRRDHHRGDHRGRRRGDRSRRPGARPPLDRQRLHPGEGLQHLRRRRRPSCSPSTRSTLSPLFLEAHRGPDRRLPRRRGRVRRGGVRRAGQPPARHRQQGHRRRRHRPAQLGRSTAPEGEPTKAPVLGARSSSRRTACPPASTSPGPRRPSDAAPQSPTLIEGDGRDGREGPDHRRQLPRPGLRAARSRSTRASAGPAGRVPDRRRRRRPGLGQDPGRRQGRQPGRAGDPAGRRLRQAGQPAGRDQGRPTRSTSSSTSSPPADRPGGCRAWRRDKSERLLNLLIMLLVQRHYVSKDRIRSILYPDSGRRGVREDVRARQGRPAQPRGPDRGRQHRRLLRRRAGLPDPPRRVPAARDRADRRRGRRGRPRHPGLGARPARRGDHRGGAQADRRSGCRSTCPPSTSSSRGWRRGAVLRRVLGGQPGPHARSSSTTAAPARPSSRPATSSRGAWSATPAAGTPSASTPTAARSGSSGSPACRARPAATGQPGVLRRPGRHRHPRVTRRLAPAPAAEPVTVLVRTGTGARPAPARGRRSRPASPARTTRTALGPAGPRPRRAWRSPTSCWPTAPTCTSSPRPRCARPSSPGCRAVVDGRRRMSAAGTRLRQGPGRPAADAWCPTSTPAARSGSTRRPPTSASPRPSSSGT